MEKKYLSVGFVDLTDYSKLLESVGMEQSVTILQDAFKKAGDIILKHKGKIWKYIGDLIMFTVDDPQEAVLLAQEIASSIVREDSRFNLRFNVTIATGEVLVGKIGHPSCMVEDVMGEPVIKAALMKSEAARNRVGFALCPVTKKYLVKV